MRTPAAAVRGFYAKKTFPLEDAAMHSLDKYITNLLKGKVLIVCFYIIIPIKNWIIIQKITSTTIRLPQPVIPLREDLLP